ncbi:glycine cleavage system regulatory protein [Pseudomonas duriflava]|uniref:Glycine cleavage system transcriptional repressor n=1 Tax=Pseudomonas duriflava TaxID=459528 RepID=A0A562QJ00_9PSED|nr:ACT domain-containing protein [Pseudomonas duriflava]TWI56737.1 glycine cleavage system regulatory protein [Pseudomonas duriflava]
MDVLVLTIIAPDQPGLVGRLADCVAAHGGNWLESRMSRMAGQFAGILTVSVAEEQRALLMEGLRSLDVAGLRVLVAESQLEAAGVVQLIQLELVGNDRPGIVRDITRQLSQLGVNVERLSTDVRTAPMSSEQLFHATALLALPATLELETLRQSLETLADELMVELNVYRDNHAEADGSSL